MAGPSLTCCARGYCTGAPHNRQPLASSLSAAVFHCLHEIRGRADFPGPPHTKARKYVDWEIASSLRNDPVNGRSGLLGINMKSVGGRGLAPPRLNDNYDSKNTAGSYALYRTYPSTAQVLHNAIQMAFDRRETHIPVNTRALFKYNRPCP